MCNNDSPAFTRINRRRPCRNGTYAMTRIAITCILRSCTALVFLPLPSAVFSQDQFPPLASIDSCVPKEVTSRILASANPNDSHPDWRGESNIGLSWSLRPKRYVHATTGRYLVGDLISPRGGVITRNVFVIYKEWVCKKK